MDWYRYPALKDLPFEAGIKRIQAEVDALMAKWGYVHDPENCCYIAERPNDSRVALFAHEGFGKAFMSCLLDIPYPLLSTRLDLGHSQFSVIEFPNSVGSVIPHILQYSNDSHLYREGLPTNYQNRVRF